jgi:hypothetical protein
VANQHGHAVQIAGSGVNSSSITRTGDKCHGVVEIIGSSQVEVSDFSIVEDGNPASCPNGGQSIAVYGGSDAIQVGRVRIDSPDKFGIVIGDATDVLIFGATIVDAKGYGILATPVGGRASSLRFISNTIYGTWDAGIFADADYINLSYNLIYDNHLTPAYGGYGGGQIGIGGTSSHVHISHNVIWNSTGVPGVEGGIELAPLVQVAEIDHNRLLHDSQFGITWDPPTPSRPRGNIWIHNNEIVGANPYTPQLNDPSVVKDTPCVDSSCLSP